MYICCASGTYGIVKNHENFVGSSKFNSSAKHWENFLGEKKKQIQILKFALEL